MGIGSAIAGIGSALIGASSAKKAAKAQSKAADQQYQLQKDIYDDTKSRFQPYEQAGGTALDAYMYEMGLGAAPTVGGSRSPLNIETISTPDRFTGGRPDSGIIALGNGMRSLGATLTSEGRSFTPGSTQYRVNGQTFNTMDEARAYADANAKTTGGKAYQGFTATPGYQFRVDQGNDSINALAGSQGGLLSGKTLQNLASFNQNIASEEYGNYMTRLAGLTDMGQAAAGNQASAGNAFASGAANALANKGNAQAAGYAGVGNALQSGIGNGIGIWQYQQGLNKAR